MLSNGIHFTPETDIESKGNGLMFVPLGEELVFTNNGRKSQIQMENSSNRATLIWLTIDL